MNLLKYLPEIFFGQIPEAIYFALFMIYVKKLDKRPLFILLVTMEYVLIMETIRYNLWSHILVFIMTYIILKMLYGLRSQIIDIFTLGIASIILILINSVTYLIVWKTIGIYSVFIVISRILMFAFILLTKDKLYKIQELYKKLWNRNDKIPKKMKSVTFRALNITTFNFMFFIINLGIIFILTHGGD